MYNEFLSPWLCSRKVCLKWIHYFSVAFHAWKYIRVELWYNWVAFWELLQQPYYLWGTIVDADYQELQHLYFSRGGGLVWFGFFFVLASGYWGENCDFSGRGKKKRPLWLAVFLRLLEVAVKKINQCTEVKDYGPKDSCCSSPCVFCTMDIFAI